MSSVLCRSGLLRRLGCRSFDLAVAQKVTVTPSLNYATTTFAVKKRSPILMGVLAGVVFGAGYTYLTSSTRDPSKVLLNPDGGTKVLEKYPQVPVTRMVRYATDTSGLKLTLFQYPTCPFCCKVRSFLDYNGISYDVVEVNPVMKQELSWSDYKKVPILLVKVQEGYLQLNDSSMIISSLSSYLMDKLVDLKRVASYYSPIEFVDEEGKTKTEILNRYFLMYHHGHQDEKLTQRIAAERKWRKWADDVLVHTLSPNVYRTTGEALDAFNWFSKVGEWEIIFPSWERLMIIYVGALAMFLIAKRLKSKYGLKSDVRESLYDGCNHWLRELKKLGTPFHGGSTPDLADLAVYGVLSSIEGCQAFADARANTKIAVWYDNMTTQIATHSGGSAPVRLHE